MKNIFLLFLSLCLFSQISIAQEPVKGRSKTGSFGTPPPKSPILSAKLEFFDQSGDNVLDADEIGLIRVTIINSGGKSAKKVVVQIKPNKSFIGISFDPSIQLGDIPPEKSAKANFKIVADKNISSQTVTFVIEATDESGAKIEPVSININTKEAKDETPPEIELREPTILSTRNVKPIREKDKLFTQSSSMKVRGIAKDKNEIAMVTINGQQVNLSLTNEGMEFIGNLMLVLGDNNIEIKATDKHQNTNFLRFKIERKPEIAQQIIPTLLLKGQRWAVVIGISDYNDAEIPDLRYAHRDAESFYKILTTPLEEGGLGLPKPNIRFLTNKEATTQNIRGAINDFLKSAIEDDIVLVFFAGHGAPDPDRPNVLYLLTYNSELTRLGATAIKMKEIQDALQDYIKAKQVLIFADACHSRGVSGTVATRNLASAELVNKYLTELEQSRKGTLTFSASDIDQLSQEHTKWGGGHGVFTYYLIEGLKGEADSDQDKIVCLGELIFYVTEKVRRDTKAQQNPISSGGFDVKLPLTIIPK